MNSTPQLLRIPDRDSIRALVRDIADYPKPGIVFKDITPVLNDSAALSLAVELMTQPFRNLRVDKVVGAESRGFIFGTALAKELCTGFVPVRKPGKLPYRVRRHEYELEYGSDALEIHADALQPGEHVLIVDDLLATGGTLAACCSLVRELGATVIGVVVLIELVELRGRDKFSDVPVVSVLEY